MLFLRLARIKYYFRKNGLIYPLKSCHRRNPSLSVQWLYSRHPALSTHCLMVGTFQEKHPSCRKWCDDIKSSLWILVYLKSVSKWNKEFSQNQTDFFSMLLYQNLLQLKQLCNIPWFFNGFLIFHGVLLMHMHFITNKFRENENNGILFVK